MNFFNNSVICKNLLNKEVLGHISNYSSKKVLPTVQELKKQRSKLLAVDHGYQPTPVDRSHLLKYVPKFEELPSRNIKNSFLEGIIPLSTDQNLQEKYITFMGRVRIGRLLEDMDLFAVHIGYKYIYAPTVPENVPSPFILVTAHCDRIDYTTYQRRHNQDIKLSGFVSWVGRSSMEVIVKLEQYYECCWHEVTRALFVLVAKNATGQQSVPVNPLEPLNEMEKKIIAGGEIRKTKRKKTSSSHLSLKVPTAEELQIIHDLYMNVRRHKADDAIGKFNPNFIPMEMCKISNTIFCQPEDRNFYNTVFGGFIMRQATELAWVLGFKFFQHRPAVKHISDINFHKPISVSALLQMFARVVYTKDEYAQLIITVVATDPTKGKSAKTNTFHFTLKSSQPVKQIYPKSYHEAMLYIDGMRHFNLNIENSSTGSTDDMDQYMTQLAKT